MSPILRATWLKPTGAPFFAFGTRHFIAASIAHEGTGHPEYFNSRRRIGMEKQLPSDSPLARDVDGQELDASLLNWLRVKPH
jgi:hypothetical protein